MRRALLARPAWDAPGLPDQPAPAGDDRIVASPLQVLRILPLPTTACDNMSAGLAGWLVLTSPACVEALALRWRQGSLKGLAEPDIRLAAVGRGTADAAKAALFDPGEGGTPLLASRPILVPPDTESPDARRLLATLHSQQVLEGFAWSGQQFIVIQGRPSRPALTEGLAQSGAHVLALDLYERCDVDWPATLWESLGREPARDTGVVVTSTTVVDRLLQQCRTHGIAADHLVWCAHHRSVADMLARATHLPVRRVSLQDSHLSRDLFIDERFW